MAVAVAVVLVIAVASALAMLRRPVPDGDVASKHAALLPYIGYDVVLQLEHHPGAGPIASNREVHGTMVALTRSVLELTGGTDQYVSLFLIRRATLSDGLELGTW